MAGSAAMIRIKFRQRWQHLAEVEAALTIAQRSRQQGMEVSPEMLMSLSIEGPDWEVASKMFRSKKTNHRQTQLLALYLSAPRSWQAGQCANCGQQDDMWHRIAQCTSAQQLREDTWPDKNYFKVKSHDNAWGLWQKPAMPSRHIPETFHIYPPELPFSWIAGSPIYMDGSCLEVQTQLWQHEGQLHFRWMTKALSQDQSGLSYQVG